MSKRALVVCYGYGGIKTHHLLRPWAIASLLASQGWEVHFAGAGKYIRSFIGKEYRLHTVQDVPLAYVNGSIARQGYMSHTYEELQRMVRDDLRLIERLKPTLVVGDYRRSLSLSARIAQVPLAMITNASWTRYSVLTDWSRTVTQGSDLVDPFNTLGSEYGLSPIESLDDALTGDMTLLADYGWFSPTEHLPKDFVYIGPVFWEDFLGTRLLNSHRPTRSEPHVLVDFGVDRSSVVSDRIRKELQRASLSYLEVTYDASPLGQDMCIGQDASTSGIEFAYIGPAVAQARALVTSGGLEGIYRAIRFGVPVVGIPQSAEGTWYIDRLVKLGMARRVVQRDPGLVSTMISEALRDAKRSIPESTSSMACRLADFYQWISDL